MSTLIVHPYPDQHFFTSSLFPSQFFPVDKVNIHKTVRCKYLNKGGELTHDKALSIFRDMKWKSDLKACLLHPVVLISIGLPCFIPYLTITATGVLDVALQILCIFGVYPMGIAFDQLWYKGDWQQAYISQGKKLAEYIATLEKNPDMKVALAPLRTESEGWDPV